MEGERRGRGWGGGRVRERRVPGDPAGLMRSAAVWCTCNAERADLHVDGLFAHSAVQDRGRLPSLHPAPHTLHPTPCTLHTTPYTLLP